MALILDSTKSSSHNMRNAWMPTVETSTESENSKPKRRGASFEGKVAAAEAVRTEKAKKETEVGQGWTRVMKEKRQGLFTSACFCSNQHQHGGSDPVKRRHTPKPT